MSGEKVYDSEYTEYQLDRSWLRKKVRGMYLRHILKYSKGKTIDFGCGIGELLALLPAGSMGLEVNESTVKYCQGKGLPVSLYDPRRDAYSFSELPAGVYTSFIAAHVLEHLDDPAGVLRTISHSCSRLGVERVIIVVPGVKGFGFDKSHRTFVDRQYLIDNHLEEVSGYRIAAADYFPLPLQRAGKYFTHNELTVVYMRVY